MREASARSSEGRDAAVVVCEGRDGARGRGRDVEAFVRRVSLGRKTREGDVGGGGERGRARGPRGAHLASRLRVARRGRERDERERHERRGREEGAAEHVVEGREVVRSRVKLFRAEARRKVRLGRVSPRSTSKSTRTTPRRPHRAVRGPASTGAPRGTLGATDRTRPEV